MIRGRTTRRSVPPSPPAPSERELFLAREAEGKDVAQCLARYREELLRPFVEMRIDYDALGDQRVAEDLNRLIQLARGATE